MCWKRFPSWRPAAGCAGPRSKTSPSSRATAHGRCRPTSKARSAWRCSRPASNRRPLRMRRSRASAASIASPVVSANAFLDHLRINWLVPAMDQLFAGPASERRRFLDRLVLAVDAEHMTRVNALDRSLRSRKPSAGGSTRRPALARRHRARNRRTRGRGQRHAGRDSVTAAGHAGRAPRSALAVPSRRHFARWLDGQARHVPSGGRNRGPLPQRPARQTVRATPPPAARSTARISPTFQ